MLPKLQNREISLTHLPVDLLVVIFSFCDIKTLTILARVCKQFQDLTKYNSVWKRHYKNLTCVHYSCHPDEFYLKPRMRSHLSFKEFCRLSANWRLWNSDVKIIRHYDRQLPWIILDSNMVLWVSNKNIISSYNLGIKRVQEFPKVSFRCGTYDVNRFAVKRNILIAGYRDGSAACFNLSLRQLDVHMKGIHQKEIQAVDVFDDEYVITGSFDGTVKIINRYCSIKEVKKLSLNDRVLSLTPVDHKILAVGTACVKYFPSPISIWDIQVGELISYAGSNFKHGAGILDMKNLDDNILATADYDSCIKIWDLRRPSLSVITFEDLGDSAVYCIAPDYKNVILSGSARGSQSFLWDIRFPGKPVQVYHCGCSSPVYSLAFNPTSLFMALDQCLVKINFN